MDWQKIARNLKKNYDEKSVRRLKDMKSSYADQKEVKKILKKINPVIYRVYVKDFDEENFLALTVLKKGTVGKEYYMTKGHSHKIPAKEDYVLTKGKGKILIENEKYSKVIPLKKNKKITIPKNYAHRTINDGDEDLEFLSIYGKKIGHDYSFKFRKRLLKD